MVDTGLTASSQELIKTYGAKIIDYQGEHISEALNYGLQQATGDWIIWLDANEYLVESADSRLRELIYEETCDVVFLHVQEAVETKGDRFNVQLLDYARPRLFRNGIGFSFVGKLQAVTLNFQEVFQVENNRTQIYSACRIVGAQSLTQDPTILQPHLTHIEHKLWSQSVRSPWSYYELACEYFRYQQFEYMVKHLNEGVTLFLENKLIPPSIFYVLKYSEVLERPLSHDMCRGLELALQMYPDHTDLHFYRGLIYYRRQQYKEALATFAACIQPDNKSGFYSISQGAGSYRTFYFKGKCLERLKRREEAAQAYMQSIAGMNVFNPAIESLKRMEKER